MDKQKFVETYFTNINVKDKINIQNMYEKYKDIISLKNDCSFFKYYPLNDKYTVSNISLSILHFSNPNNFNDPFDSLLGISIEKILKNNFKKVLMNEIKQSGRVTSEQFSMIEKIFEDSDNDNLIDYLEEIGIMDLIPKGEKMKELSKEQIASIINKVSPSRNEKILRKLLSGEWTSERFENELLKSKYAKAKVNQEINKKININLFSKDDIFVQLETIFEKNGIDYDLSSTKEKIKEVKNNFFNEIKLKIGTEFRMTCFSEKYDNILMWSHYADKHNGICVEYDFLNCENGIMMLLFPILYQENRLVLSDEQFIFDGKEIRYEMEDLKKIISKSLLIKSQVWDYEKEWRVIIPKSKLDQNDNIVAPPIKTIYFGVNVPDDKINELIRIMRPIYPKAKYVKMKLDDDKFGFVEQEIV